MRLCYFGTYRPEYMRNQINMAALRQAGVEVIECHQPLWRDDLERVQVAAGGWKNPLFWLRAAGVYLRLIVQYLRAPDHDLVILGYPGHLDIFLARPLTWLRRKPLLWDVILSVVQVSRERGLDKKTPLSLKLLKLVEGAALRLPDLRILDTPQYVEWFLHEYHITDPRLRFDYLLIGADDRYFTDLAAKIAQETPPTPDGIFRVVYAGSYIPNHGVPVIIEAARLLADDPAIQFSLIGKGIGKQAAESLAQQYGLSNITFIDWVEKPDLVRQLLHADIVLGAFGNTVHSLITIHNKTYEGMALGKLVLTGDSPAVRQFLHPGEDLYVCAQDDPAALAQAIRQLKADPDLRRQIGKRARQTFEQAYTLQHVGQNYLALLEKHFGLKPDPLQGKHL